MATLIREVRLIMADTGVNSYKYWNAKLYDDDTVHAEWARVGAANPASGQWSGGAAYLDKKVREKMKKGYSEQKTIGEAVATPSSGKVVQNSELRAIAKAQLLKSSNPTLDRLIQRLVDANVHKITTSTQITYNSTTGLFTTPLGIVTIDGLTEARTLLAELATYVRGRRFGEQADAVLCKYLRIIPQSIGMKRFSTDTLIPDDNALQKQSDLIDSLESSYQAMSTQPKSATSTSKPLEQVFKVDLDVLSSGHEYNRLNDWYEKSKKDMHNYGNIRVRQIYTVNVHEMTNRFENKTVPIQEVFHGTSQANCLSILKSGLKTSPPSTAAIAGKMFGNGVYGAINSSKSLGYSLGRWGQGGVGDGAWLFICQFAMGRTQTAYNSCNVQSGYDSIWAKAGRGLYNDELIVFRNSQVKITHLLECR